MKKSSLTALLVVIVSGMVGAHMYAAAAGCDPGSGCCGTGQTYVGQPLFANPAGPYHVNIVPAANPPQPMNAKQVIGSPRTTRAAQSKATPIVPLTQPAAGKSTEGVTFSSLPFLGTLW